MTVFKMRPSTLSLLAVTAILVAAFTVTTASGDGDASPDAYRKEVLMDLCQFIGVRYVRDPENEECGYITCWDQKPYHMACSPGLQVHPYFQWGDSYPCTDRDFDDRCGYLKKVTPAAYRVEKVLEARRTTPYKVDKDLRNTKDLERLNEPAGRRSDLSKKKRRPKVDKH